MTRAILGLDVGGANLKAATPDGRARSVPFALWKQPDRLPAALAELVGQFPEVGELAVTMTGELCDCFETKRQGVNSILDAVEFAAAGRPVRVWGTGGKFLSVAAGRAEHMVVAAANWHALATFVGRWVPTGPALLIDVGSTTTDLIPLRDGRPAAAGRTDAERLDTEELLYLGVRRTPVCALAEWVANELFATTLDVYLVLGLIAEDPADTDTADGRPATKVHAHARLSRMLGGDPELTSEAATYELADQTASWHFSRVESALARLPEPAAYVVSGSGGFVALDVLCRTKKPVIRFDARLPAAVSACAPAFAVAVLASERPL